MNFRPLLNQVVIELDPAETMKGSIIIPQTKDTAPVSGRIIAIGSGKQFSDGNKSVMETKVGDKVLFGKFSGSEIWYNDKQYIVMSEEDIMAIVEEDLINEI